MKLLSSSFHWHNLFKCRRYLKLSNLWMKSSSVTIQMKGTAVKYFPVLLFIIFTRRFFPSVELIQRIKFLCVRPIQISTYLTQKKLVMSQILPYKLHLLLSRTLTNLLVASEYWEVTRLAFCSLLIESRIKSPFP